MPVSHENFEPAIADKQGVRWREIEKSLSGFDLTDVRTLVGGNADLYLKMLAQFHADYLEEGVDFVFNLGIDERAKAESMLHKLKGVAGNLGARDLNLACEKLDEQLKMGTYGEREFELWEKIFQETLDQVGWLLENMPRSEAAQRREKRHSMLKASLVELEELLAEGRYVEDELIERIKPNIEPSEVDLFATLLMHIDAVDYPKARSTLRTLIYLTNAVGK